MNSYDPVALAAFITLVGLLIGRIVREIMKASEGGIRMRRLLALVFLLLFVQPASAYSISSVPRVEQHGIIEYSVAVAGLPANVTIVFNGYEDLGNGIYRMNFTIYEDGIANETIIDRNFDQYSYVYDEQKNITLPLYDPERHDALMNEIKQYLAENLSMQVTVSSGKVTIGDKEFSVDIIEGQNENAYIEIQLAKKVGFVAYFEYRISIFGIAIDYKIIAKRTNLQEPSIISELSSPTGLAIAVGVIVVLIALLKLIIGRKQ